MRNEIMWLVCQPKWVIKKLRRYCRSQSRNDLGNLRECVKTFMRPTDSKVDDVHWLYLLQRAIRLRKKEKASSTRVSMPSFQLYSRLVQCGGSNR